MGRNPTGRMLAAPLLVAALAIAGCGSSSGTSAKSTATPAKPAATVAGVPSALSSKGTATVATDASYAPMEFVGSDGTTIEGADADLAKAIGRAMGIDVSMKNAGFPSIIPGLAAHKYDFSMSSFTDTKARQKTVDFVTYLNVGTGFFEKTGGPAVTGLADLCGKSVAVEQGTTQADDTQAQSAKCKQQGKSGVQVATYPDQNAANLAITSGRQQIGLADFPVAAYQVKKSGGQLKLVGRAYGTAPYGIAMPKDTGLAKPILAAVQQVMKDGQYEQILAKWGLQAAAIDNPQINGATS